MKNKPLVFFAFILSVIQISCVWCSAPPVKKIRLTNFDYCNDNITQTFPTDKDNLLTFCSRISNELVPYDDSTFSATFQVGDERIFATAKVDLINEDTISKIQLRLIDTLTFYAGREDDEILYKVDKEKCINAFQKQYIPNLIIAINRCLKMDSLYQEGVKQLHSGNYDKSYSLFQTAANISLSDNDVFKFEKYSALNRMAYIKLQQKQYDKSIELLNRALSIEPWWLNLDNRTQFRTNGELPHWVKDTYIDELKSEYKYNSENTEQLLLHANLALAYLKAGKLQESKSAIDKAEKLYPSEPYFVTIKDMYRNELK